MANILSYIELDGSSATIQSLKTLACGRNIATALGATLHAIVPCVGPPSYDDDDIIATLSRHGADKVLLLTHPELVPPTSYKTYGTALAGACRQFSAKIVLFPRGVESIDFAARLAAVLRAYFFPNATFTGDEVSPVFNRSVFGGAYVQTIDLSSTNESFVFVLDDNKRPLEIVAQEEAEVAMIQASIASDTTVSVIDSPTLCCPGGNLTIGGGTGLGTAHNFALLDRIAKSLQADVVATPAACAAGLAPASQMAGLNGRSVESAHYLALGVTGTLEHLHGIAPHTEVIAVNNDPRAPIFSIARTKIVDHAPSVLKRIAQELSVKQER